MIKPSLGHPEINKLKERGYNLQPTNIPREWVLYESEKKEQGMQFSKTIKADNLQKALEVARRMILDNEMQKSH